MKLENVQTLFIITSILNKEPHLININRTNEILQATFISDIAKQKAGEIPYG